MTMPKLTFDGTFTAGSVFSALLWLCSMVWLVSASNAQVEQVEREVTAHLSRLNNLERYGTEVSRADHARVTRLEAENKEMQATLATMKETLARIDENVKALKGR